MTEVTMPKAGLSMTEGLIQEWCVKEGDTIAKGDVLLVIETDKSSLEVEAPASGVVKKITAKAGETIPVNATIAWIGDGIEATDTIDATKTPQAEANTAAREEDQELPGANRARAFAFQSEQRKEPFVKASPAARRLAREHHMDWQTVAGSGPMNRIIQKDIQALIEKGIGEASKPAAASATSAADPVQPKPAVLDDGSQHLTGIRKVIARRMSESARTIPHVTLHTKLDVTSLQKFRNEIQADVNRQKGESISFTHLLIKIVARALQEHPDVNVSLSGEGYVRHAGIHIGVAVDTDRGLLVPVISHANQLSLTEIARRSKELVEKAKAGTLAPDELGGGTFTISNLGSFGIDEFTPIINYPEAAILGVGRTLQLPWVVEDAVVPRPILTLSLSFDHRVVDGAPAARFLQTISRYAASPYLLV